MPMVSSEFRIGAFERGIAMGFGLLDAIRFSSSISERVTERWYGFMKHKV